MSCIRSRRGRTAQFEPVVGMSALLEFLRFLYTGRSGAMDPLTALEVLFLTKGEHGSGGKTKAQNTHTLTAVVDPRHGYQDFPTAAITTILPSQGCCARSRWHSCASMSVSGHFALSRSAYRECGVKGDLKEASVQLARHSCPISSFDTRNSGPSVRALHVNVCAMATTKGCTRSHACWSLG